MGLHRNARLGLAGRRALVADVVAGCSCREAARRRGVSPTTACKWWRRWDWRARGSTVAGVSWRIARRGRIILRGCLAVAERELICAADDVRVGSAADRGETGHAHATVWRALRRAGISRPARQPREQPRRYEWPCPGDLLHIDTKRFARFSRPGHAVTGDRHTTAKEMRMRVGYEWVHSLVDDHSRVAYSELHRNERADNRHRLRHPRPRLLRQPRDHTETAHVRQRLDIHPQPPTRPAARRARHPPSADPTTPATSQRQGRALPADPQTRMGTRPDLPLKRAPLRRADILAPTLQRAQTPQLTRRPTTHQPRPQRPEAGHLGRRRPLPRRPRRAAALAGGVRRGVGRTGQVRKSA